MFKKKINIKSPITILIVGIMLIFGLCYSYVVSDMTIPALALGVYDYGEYTYDSYNGISDYTVEWGSPEIWRDDKFQKDGKFRYVLRTHTLNRAGYNYYTSSGVLTNIPSGSVTIKRAMGVYNLESDDVMESADWVGHKTTGDISADLAHNDIRYDTERTADGYLWKLTENFDMKSREGLEVVAKGSASAPSGAHKPSGYPGTSDGYIGADDYYSDIIVSGSLTNAWKTNYSSDSGLDSVVDDAKDYYNDYVAHRIRITEAGNLIISDNALMFDNLNFTYTYRKKDFTGTVDFYGLNDDYLTYRSPSKYHTPFAVPDPSIATKTDTLWFYAGEGSYNGVVGAGKDIDYTITATGWKKRSGDVVMVNNSPTNANAVIYGESGGYSLEAVGNKPTFIDTPPNPTPPRDYHFNGWPSNSTIINNIPTITEYTAQKTTTPGYTGKGYYAPNSYTLYFHHGDGSTTSKTVYYDNTVGTMPVDKKVGYHTGYWATSSGEEYDASTIFQEVNDVHLYNHWTPNKYVVQFMGNRPSNSSNYVSGSTSSITYTYDTNASLPYCGYYLLGWKYKDYWTTFSSSGRTYEEGYYGSLNQLVLDHGEE